MRDGVRLSADVYRPRMTGCYPAIVQIEGARELGCATSFPVARGERRVGAGRSDVRRRLSASARPHGARAALERYRSDQDLTGHLWKGSNQVVCVNYNQGGACKYINHL